MANDKQKEYHRVVIVLEGSSLAELARMLVRQAEFLLQEYCSGHQPGQTSGSWHVTGWRNYYRFQHVSDKPMRSPLPFKQRILDLLKTDYQGG